MQPTTLEAQQAALREVRARYERGELDSETFERALDALLLARDAEECTAVLAALPHTRSPRWRRSTPPPPPHRPPRRSRPCRRAIPGVSSPS